MHEEVRANDIFHFFVFLTYFYQLNFPNTLVHLDTSFTHFPITFLMWFLVSSLSISDILEKFRRDGTPVRSDLVRLEPRVRR